VQSLHGALVDEEDRDVGIRADVSSARLCSVRRSSTVSSTSTPDSLVISMVMTGLAWEMVSGSPGREVVRGARRDSRLDGELGGLVALARAARRCSSYSV
jgi:hypothetical protein